MATVMGDYFSALRVPLLRGRTFTPQDTSQAPRVIVIDQLLAERYFPNEEPIGKHISHIGANQNDGDPEQYEIVGVVGDVHHSSLTRPPAPELYLPYQQNSWDWGTFRKNVGMAKKLGITDAQMGAVTRHALGNTAIFADGHAKWLRWNQVGDSNSDEWRAVLEPGFDLKQ